MGFSLYFLSESALPATSLSGTWRASPIWPAAYGPALANVEDECPLVHQADRVLGRDRSKALNPCADLGHDDEHDHEGRC